MPARQLGFPCATMLALALLALAACGAQGASVTPTRVAAIPVIAFPQQAPTVKPRALLAAWTEGTLALVDGCLRVTGPGGTSDLILWPPEVALRTDGGDIRVVDPSGRVVARVGEPLIMGGGQIPTVAGDRLREAPPARCLGPYWLAGEILAEAPRPLSVPSPVFVADPADGLDRDAAAYAAAHGVDLPEARRRLQLQDAIGKLGAALAKDERDTFAGLWVEHRPAYRIVVRFTRDGEQTLQPYLAGGPLAGLVEIRPARFTLAELEAAQADTLRLTRPLGVPTDVRLAIPENRVDLATTDRARLDAALRAAAITLPPSVVILPTATPTR